MRYSGEMIEVLIQMSERAELKNKRTHYEAQARQARRDMLRFYQLMDSKGKTSGREFEMLESEAEAANLVLSSADLDCRWCEISERGSR
jgi:hypothetical protein